MSQTDIIKDRVWELKVTSWRGVSFGAMHYYGRLSRDIYAPGSDGYYFTSSEECEVQRILTSDAARALNRKDNEFSLLGMGGDMRAGEWTGRFDSREDVRSAAIAIWRSLADEGDRLVLDDPYSEGEELLAGDSSAERFQPGKTRSGAGNPLERIDYYDRVAVQGDDGTWSVQEQS